jgi:hypothetical protein
MYHRLFSFSSRIFLFPRKNHRWSTIMAWQTNFPSVTSTTPPRRAPTLAKKFSRGMLTAGQSGGRIWKAG